MSKAGFLRADPCVNMRRLPFVTDRAVFFLAGRMSQDWTWERIDKSAFEKCLHYILDWAPGKIYHHEVITSEEVRDLDLEKRVIDVLMQRIRDRRSEVLKKARGRVMKDAKRIAIRVYRSRIEIVGVRR